MRLTLPLEKSKRNEKINRVIKKSLQVNLAIGKQRVSNPTIGNY
jgi:hypothetical protein